VFAWDSRSAGPINEEHGMRTEAPPENFRWVQCTGEKKIKFLTETHYNSAVFIGLYLLPPLSAPIGGSNVRVLRAQIG